MAPRFFDSVAHLPVRGTFGIGNWTSAFQQLTGPMIPAALINAIPAGFLQLLLGTPVWKEILALLAVVIVAAVLVMLRRLLARFRPSKRETRSWMKVVTPLVILGATNILHGFFVYQVNLGGEFARGINQLATLITYLTLAWTGWQIAPALMESVIRNRRFPQQHLSAEMLRLIARLIGILLVFVALGFGAQSMGLPVVSVVAGLGIGGLAIALAVRPTVENLIGGFILYIDKPIRVGDFCTFGEQSGTVEIIGMRSTQIRAIDRTVITVPNAQFADMQLTNWAQCDRMMIETKIGLRYETSADQLRFVLAKIREMIHAHPRIDNETVRLRFAGYGDYSLDIDIRIYAETREWNDYYAIREDVLLRIMDVVENAGSGFAFPSQVLYLGRDEGIDSELGTKAEEAVSDWRRKGELPFPNFAATKLRKLDASLHYPPRGSPDFRASESELQAANQERLSAEPLSGPIDDDEDASEEEQAATARPAVAPAQRG